MTSPTTAPARSDDEIIDSISTAYEFGWHDSESTKIGRASCRERV